MAHISIIGGHGKIALRLARLLSEAGHDVTSIIRNPDQTGDVTATGANARVADVSELDTAGLSALLSGSDAVVWSAGAGGGDASRTYAVDRDAAIRSIDAAAEAGVRRYVLVSYFGASLNHGVSEDSSFYAYAEAKAEADEHLRKSALDWTIVAPSSLTDDEGTGTIDVHADSSSQVSRDDVAAVIAAVIDTPSTVHRFIAFNHGDTPIGEALAA
ncbi:SDR family oxidoreductase [Williamsia sterculiae]|uniref:Putative NADH-flavin reductase n=1 Tax=Williamsia sterculiae TaxID=1344003 RepID=A0A1N7FT03_9NOCA|nr:SDR family oxidoreductase [Williamsia sterculiae]SIS03404.1 Putative NADH-flavin reductase [Williamsia sterculiae]